MIKRLRAFAERLNTFKNSKAVEIIYQVIKDNEDDVIDLNIDQMEEGIDSEGELIRPAYSPMTISIKKKKGQPYKIVTLKDKGDFHESVFLIYTGDSIKFTADDSKTKKLRGKYGQVIFGLNKSSLRKFRNFIAIPILRSWKQYLLNEKY